MSYKPGPYDEEKRLPITGDAHFYQRQVGTRQSRPIDRKKVLRYEKTLGWNETIYSYPGRPIIDVRIGQGYQAVTNSTDDELGVKRNHDLATVKAIDRFIDKMHDTADLGITIATAGQALDMITNRAIQLRRAYSHLRRGRITKFCKELGVRKKPGHPARTRPRDASALWLEYWFGWSPLIADIGAAVDVLQSEFPDDFVFATAKVKGVSSKLNRSGMWWRRHWQWSWVVSTRVQANVIVTNPNLYKANQLGLVNPAVVVWDIVPFSFVVDWFLPVGSFLQSFSTFAGIKLENAQYYQKRFVEGWESEVGVSQPWRFQGTYMRMHREPGFPPRKFKIPNVKLPSATRAATAISLLVQLFIKP